MKRWNEHGHVPGPIVLFGSGETSPSGRKIFDTVLRELGENPRVAMLETPAGFELNSAQVIGRVADFISHRLQNYHPRIEIVPARMRGTPFSPDASEIIEPIFDADLIFMGPGSPTYAVRQLSSSAAWHALLARHRLGAAVALASAAVVAVSTYALPVYEIYKVGEDLHWKDGLDLFGFYGLPLVFIPHWNNNDGGDELDTSRCFMGQSRFARLMEMLPADLTVVGIDEKTALIIHPQNGTCEVVGLGGVTLVHTGQAHHDAVSSADLSSSGLNEVAEQRRGHVHQFRSSEKFELHRIGELHKPDAWGSISEVIWKRALEKRDENPAESVPLPTAQVLALVDAREGKRMSRDWQAADRLRAEIEALGWKVVDTPDGPRLEQNH